jgi:hypothetical protein
VLIGCYFDVLKVQNSECKWSYRWIDAYSYSRRIQDHITHLKSVNNKRFEDNRFI